MKKSRSFAALVMGAVMLISLVLFTACAEKKQEGFLTEYEISDLAIEKDETIAFGDTIGDCAFFAMTATAGEFSMKYRVYIPDDVEEMTNMPLLLFLHGAGERGVDNKKQILTYSGMEAIFAEDSPTAKGIVIVPQCPANKQWVDFANINHGETNDGTYSVDTVSESEAMQMALKIVKYYTENYSVDKNRIYAMGMSMGGYGTWDILTRHQGLLAAAIPMCGGADTSKAEMVKDTPVYTFHGARDPIVPPTGTRAMVEALEKIDGNIQYKEYADGSHDIWNRVMNEEGLMTWLYSNSKLLKK